MTLFAVTNGGVTSYVYNSDGIRTQKVHYDENAEYVGVTKYTLDGNKIVAENRLGTNIYYTYDDKGAIMGMIYGGQYYLFSKNLQGDVIGIYTDYGNLVAKYEYNAFGVITAITNASGTDVSNNASHIANINPFRYRGYYYDTETGFYYLQTRYYDPVVGRFINRDTSEILTATPTGLTDKNLFAYCDNNPIMHIDQGGQFWDTFFDVVSLVSSVVDVCKNPSDPWAWAGLVGDVVDLVPFVTCVGETVKVAKTANKVVDAVDTAHDVAKAADKVEDVVDAGTTVNKSTKYARSKAVKEAWGNEADLVRNTGTGTRAWTDAEKLELLNTGKVKGYHGHHMKSVKGYPELAGDPFNIQFLTRKEHLMAHGGNWRNITHGRYIP